MLPAPRDAATHIPALSGLRGLAALTVFCSHSAKAGLLPDVFGTGTGHMGVMLFFVLSAFLMTHLYLDRPATADQLQRFAVARFARVYPLFLVMLTSGLAASILGFDYPYATDLKTWAQNALLVGRFQVFWTVCTEFQFYLAFAILWWLGWRVGRVRTVALAAALLSMLLVFLSIHAYPSGGLFKVAQFFGAGVLAGLIRKAIVERRLHLPGADVLLAALLILFGLSFPDVFERLTGFRHGGFWSPWLLILCLGIVLTASIARGPVARALGSPVGEWLGDLSFAIYLLHIPAIFFVSTYLRAAPDILKFPLTLAIVLGAAWLVFTQFERPARRAINARFGGRTAA